MNILFEPRCECADVCVCVCVFVYVYAAGASSLMLDACVRMYVLIIVNVFVCVVMGNRDI